MDNHVNDCILSRLFDYVKDIVNQRVVLPREILFKQFEQETNISLGGKRQQLRYLAALKHAFHDSGIQFLLGIGNRGKKLYITSESKSNFDANYDKEALYSKILLKALQKTKVTDVKVYDILLANTKTRKRYMEKVVRKMKNKAEQFGLVYFYRKRNLRACLRSQYETKKLR